MSTSLPEIIATDKTVVTSLPGITRSGSMGLISALFKNKQDTPHST